jgi:hypothetical protein
MVGLKVKAEKLKYSTVQFMSHHQDSEQDYDLKIRVTDRSFGKVAKLPNMWENDTDDIYIHEIIKNVRINIYKINLFCCVSHTNGRT